jgi:hypothetical protein
MSKGRGFVREAANDFLSDQQFAGYGFSVLLLEELPQRDKDHRAFLRRLPVSFRVAGQALLASARGSVGAALRRLTVTRHDYG